MSGSACSARKGVLQGLLGLLGLLGPLAWPAGALAAAPAELAMPAAESRPAPRPAAESRPAPRLSPRLSPEAFPALKPLALEGPARSPRWGWALAAAVVGTVGAGAVFGLALGAEWYRPRRELPTVALSGAFVGVGTLLAPLVYVGGWMARERHGVGGSWALRSLGWAAYGGMIASTVAFAVRSSKGTLPETGMITFTGALGALGLLCLSGDALISFLRARRAARLGRTGAVGPGALGPRVVGPGSALEIDPESAAENDPESSAESAPERAAGTFPGSAGGPAPAAPVPLWNRLRLVPLLAPLRSPDGGLGGVAGIQGTF